MINHKTKLIAKKEVAFDTMAFYFERPENYIFKAGQSVDLTLIDPSETDEEGNTRTFSLAGAPYVDSLMIATRLRDTAFKSVLRNISLGEELMISEAMGSYVLHNDSSKAAIFLIGGIGITPIRSILLDAAKRNLPHKLYLFYSNRSREDAPFLSELRKLTKLNQNFKMIVTMTAGANGEKMRGDESGYINEEMIKKYIPDFERAIWYMSGPQKMVKAMRSILEKININDDYIRTEEFAGY